MPSQLKITEEQKESFVKVYLSGEVDIYSSQELKDKLYEIVDAKKMDLEIDCKDLQYIDSTGLGIFVGTLKKLKQDGKKVIISNLKDNIKKLFLITGLDRVFEIKE